MTPGGLAEAIRERRQTEAEQPREMREEERYCIEQVGLCSGNDVRAIYTWLRELDTVPQMLRLRVMDRTSRGVLKEVLREHQRRQPHGQWEGIKDAIAMAFTAKEHRVGLREELTRITCIRKQPFELLAVFATRFKQLAYRAYPEPRERTVEAHLVRSFCQGTGQ